MAWSPYDATTFLSCGSDGVVLLWSADTSRPLWTFAPPGPAALKAEVADVAWCPGRSTAFAAAVGNSLQLWDLEHSALRPLAAAPHYGIKLTALRFSPGAPVLAAGGSDGSVAVYSVAALAAGDKGAGDTDGAAEEEQRRRLRVALRARVENKQVAGE